MSLEGQPAGVLGSISGSKSVCLAKVVVVVGGGRGSLSLTLVKVGDTCLLPSYCHPSNRSSHIKLKD